MTIDDLRHALTATAENEPADSGRAALTSLDDNLRQLADLTLIDASPDIVMHPWTAALITRHAPDTRILHERALAMRSLRVEEDHATYEDLTEIPRHLASLGNHDDAVSFATQVARILPGTLATLAYLAEIRPQVPSSERAWILIADLEVQALLNVGDLNSALHQLQAIHHQVQTRAAADPANTGWQRDLSVSHNNIGNIASAAGDLTAARASYQAALDIAMRLTGDDPANAALAEKIRQQLKQLD